MSNPSLMLSLAGIAGGLGRGPAREMTGVAKERVHLRNLPSWEREGAKSEYDQIVAKAKADRAAAIAEWFNRYPAAMPVEFKKIDKVVASFLAGRSAEAAASGVSTDGVSLILSTNAVSRDLNTKSTRSGAVEQVVASRRSANDRFIDVCPGLFGEGKAARYTANSVLRHMGAGIRVTDITRGKGDEGFAFFTPNRASRQGRIVVPDRCVRVEVSKKIRDSAIKAAYGVDEMGPTQQFTRDELMPPEMGPAPRKQTGRTTKRKMTAKDRKRLEELRAKYAK